MYGSTKECGPQAKGKIETGKPRPNRMKTSNVTFHRKIIKNSDYTETNKTEGMTQKKYEAHEQDIRIYTYNRHDARKLNEA